MQAGGSFFHGLPGCFRFGHQVAFKFKRQFATHVRISTPLLATKMRPVFMYTSKKIRAAGRKRCPIFNSKN